MHGRDLALPRRGCWPVESVNLRDLCRADRLPVVNFGWFSLKELADPQRLWATWGEATGVTPMHLAHALWSEHPGG